MENGRSWLGSFQGEKSVRTFHLCYKNPISVLYDYLWPPSLACSFPNSVCYWLSKQKITQLNNAPSAWNNGSCRIREQIKIQIWKRYRTTLSSLVKKANENALTRYNMKYHLTCQSMDSSASNISYHCDMVWENLHKDLATSGFSFEARGRTFRPVVFHSMSGTLISIFEGFFYYCNLCLIKHLVNLLTRG